MSSLELTPVKKHLVCNRLEGKWEKYGIYVGFIAHIIWFACYFINVICNLQCFGVQFSVFSLLQSSSVRRKQFDRNVLLVSSACKYLRIYLNELKAKVKMTNKWNTKRNKKSIGKKRLQKGRNSMWNEPIVNKVVTLWR